MDKQNRKNDGKFAKHYLCDACNKPAGRDPMCDDEVCGGDQVPGFILCDRARCVRSLEGLSTEQRRERYKASWAAQPVRI